MLTSPDFKELLKIFEKHKIRYLVVDGYAVMKYSEPRFTKDLDIFITTDKDNANNVYRVDIMMSIPGVDFDEAWENREVVELDAIKIYFISRSDLIRSKEASARPQDKIDIDQLKKAEQLDSLDEK